MLPVWARRQIQAFISQFIGRTNAARTNRAWIGVGSREGMEPVDRSRFDRGLMREPEGGGRIEQLVGADPLRAFVYVPGHKDPQPELWLDPGLAGHRELFEKFARTRLGALGLEGANVQIDHVFPKKAGALDGLAFVRMLAIPGPSNMDAGRTVERAMAELARGAPSPKLVRLARYVSLGKATGFVGWEQLPDSDDPSENLPAVRRLFAHLRAFGLPAEVLTEFDARLTARMIGKVR